MHVKKYLGQLAQETGMRFDDEINMIHGRVGGHNMCVTLITNTNSVQVAVSVEKNGSAVTMNELKEHLGKEKSIIGYHVDGRRVTFNAAGGIGTKKCLEKAMAALQAISAFLTTNGYVDCCERCGVTADINAYSIDDSGHNMCGPCFDSLIDGLETQKNQKASRKGNLITGLVGALLGSLLGIAAIVIVGRLGYVAAISGVIMGVCTLKGYEMFGGKANLLGISLCSLLMLFMVYVGNNIDWAFEVVAAFEATFFEAYQAIPMLIDEEVIEIGTYGYNLVLLYIFTALGAFPTIRSFSHESSGKYKAKQAA